MSDVYVAFVRDDQSYAEALAVALQGSGFTVSRSASVVEAIGECAAIVVLWTPAAARSKLFVDAADRAFRSGKMVLARMGSDPLPAMFTGVEAHPLARWSGDPESPDVDPVVFHVDRLVSRARLASGAHPQADERPQAAPRGVVHHFPSGGAATARARPMEQPQPQRMDPAPRAAPADPLAEEASFWRQVQHSTNPADFYAYLDRYGRQGAFAELAEARIQQLTARSAPAPQPPPYQPPQSYAPQQPYPQAPGPVARGPAHGPGPGGGHGPSGFSMQPPVARPMPRPQPQPQPQPQPRLDPHPARSRVEPPPAPPSRETGGGGAMRGLFLLVFLAIVGGGGFYVYQQFKGPDAAPVESADSTWEEPAASSNPADDGAAPTTGGDANQVAGGGAPGRGAEPAPSRQPQRATTPTVQPPSDGPTPEPTFRTIPAAAPPPATRAPATPGDPESAAALLRDIAPAPVAVTTPTIQPPATQPTAAARPPSRPRWAQRASGRDLTENYPAAAARRAVEGRVVLDCLIGADLAIRCRATSETPAGYGFATAALRVSQKYRSAPTMEDGRPAAGERTSIAISFKPAP